MKILCLHCDYIEWQGLKKALKSMEDLTAEEIAKKKVDECLVVLTAVEKGDNVEESVPLLIENIQKIAKDVKAENIVLYPYAHLSSNLGAPKIAVEILKDAEKKLKKEFKVSRAPFGYYKSFELKVKGHPLSELSREIVVKGNEQVIELDDKERGKLLHELSKSRLDTSKLAENDHRIIGKKMNLWSFNAAAPGMVFWHDKGLHIKNKLIDYWREVHRKANYEEISTPQIMDRKLWEVSGHWEKYHENMFTSDYEKRDFAVKPMNCPGGMLVYKATPKSYRDLPLRAGELGIVHRQELSGVLAGLFRVIQFTQDDAHIFCTEDQLEDEIGKIIDLINEMFGVMGLTLDHVELCTRPEKRIGEERFWDLAEKSLDNVLKARKMKCQLNKGDGAFYGPKIDFHLKDSLNRTWQCSTIQLDMALPERFELEYSGEDGKMKSPIMLHRVIYGSIERFMGIITEQYNGKFPMWLSPNQVKVMTMNDSVNDYAKEVYDLFYAADLRVELDSRNESIGKKVREASIDRFNYLVTIGENEAKEKVVAVKKRDEKEVVKYKLDEFISMLKEEIQNRK
ncbi:threonine--tRNA ligase [archaeon]|jgi:threonyl-tRNA synthetase|nr:threonine--tRNA ligase [archaeon]